MNRLNESSVKLCTRGSRCCPVVTEITSGNNTGGLEITDDYGGKVTLTASERDMLNSYLKDPKAVLKNS